MEGGGAWPGRGGLCSSSTSVIWGAGGGGDIIAIAMMIAIVIVIVAVISGQFGDPRGHIPRALVSRIEAIFGMHTASVRPLVFM